MNNAATARKPRKDPYAPIAYSKSSHIGKSVRILATGEVGQIVGHFFIDATCAQLLDVCIGGRIERVKAGEVAVAS
jgi:hypothetical protein